MTSLFRSPTFLAAIAGVLLAAGLGIQAGAQARVQQQPYTEKPYNPPVDSRWAIHSDSKTTEHRAAGDERNQQVSMRAELTIDEKLADGYRISYVSREIKVSGNTPGARLMGDAFGAMKDVVIRARTDAAGKPVEVLNLDEVKTALKRVVEAMAARFESNPQAGAFVRDLMLKMFDVPANEAARIYLDELPQLAAVHNIGLKPGEVRRTSDEVATPFGAALKSALVTRLEWWDDKAGQATIVTRRETDPESLKATALSAAQQMSRVGGDKNAVTSEVLEAMKSVSFSVESEARYLVENGATRSIDERSTTKASALGRTFTKQEHKTVMVLPVK